MKGKTAEVNYATRPPLGNRTLAAPAVTRPGIFDEFRTRSRVGPHFLSEIVYAVRILFFNLVKMAK
jgi:hypothetical protein